MALPDLAGHVDFALAFAVVHEMHASASFFRETAEALKPRARLLLAEPGGHVTLEQFETELRGGARDGIEARRLAAAI